MVAMETSSHVGSHISYSIAEKTALDRTFPSSDLQCLPPGDPRFLCAYDGSAISGKSFVITYFILAERNIPDCTIK